MSFFDNTFQRLPPFLYEHVTPTPLHRARLIHTTAFRKKLFTHLTDDELRAWLNGEHALAGDQRIATRYAGHQFGVWAGQLGDGRAISLGEMIQDGERFEVQTKGSGLTPFSRMGDGKAVIRSSVREYLCSEAMAGLGIPTTRVLALLTGEDEVYRERVEKSALVARVFPSNIRFGHFELCFYSDKEDELKALAEYTRTTFFEGHTLESMLDQIVARTATLLAHWQSVGFCHGVMNTDNMSILGLTIDYGPFGFLEDTNLGHICNHSDHSGRYAYNQQPSVAMWNLERLLVCFLNLVPRETLQHLLDSYPKIFEREYLRLSRRKLGLALEEDGDYPFVLSTLKMLQELSIDYTFFWRSLSRYQRGGRASLAPLFDYYGERRELLDWLSRYDERLTREKQTDTKRSEEMLKTNPKYVLKNYIAQEVIREVETGSSLKLGEWMSVFESPFEEHPSFHRYSLPTPPEQKNHVVSCSS